MTAVSAREWVLGAVVALGGALGRRQLCATFFALMRTCDGGVCRAVDWRNQETVLMSVRARSQHACVAKRGVRMWRKSAVRVVNA